MEHYLASLPRDYRELAADVGLRAGWAIAGIVTSDVVEMTNNGWSFSRRAEAERLGLRSLQLLNDFEALACALPFLHAEQLRSWDDRLPHLNGPLAVIGPGTGLGVASLIPHDGQWIPVSGEGGHATLAATDDFDAEVLRCARREWPHVSAERLLSGMGLPLLHRCVAQAAGQHEPWLEAETIVQQGLSGGSSAAHTLDVFCGLLGAFTGSVALTVGATGGVFIGGGVVPRLGDRFFQSRFRTQFEAKGRFAPYLQQIPTVLITDTLAALQGVSAAVAQRSRSTDAV